MKTTRRNGHGFTIIEMLVVIAIIAILLALLLPALSSVQDRARKNTELSFLRQTHIAWMAYANDNNDAALPGYIDEEVQQRWRIRIRFPIDPETFEENGSGGGGSGGSGTAAVGSLAQIGPSTPDDVDQTGATWTWRLMPYLEDSFESVLFYDDDSDRTTRALVQRRNFAAVHPGFGYNGLYVGGRWHMVAAESGGASRPQYYFSGATRPDSAADSMGEGSGGARVDVVSRTVSRIVRTSEVIIFSPSMRVPEPMEVRQINDVAPGYHMVTPPLVGEQLQWSHTGTETTGAGAGAGVGPSAPGGPMATGADARFVSTFASPTLVPIGRYNRLVPILRVDGSTSTQQPGALVDQRLWIDAAKSHNFRHTIENAEEDFAEFP